MEKPALDTSAWSLLLTSRKRGHHLIILGNDQPFFNGQKETLGGPVWSFLCGGTEQEGLKA